MAQMMRIAVPREVLLIEIDRHCCFPDCQARALFGITKEEATGYRGFECLHCGQWNADNLTERDIPEWWAEIKSRQ